MKYEQPCPRCGVAAGWTRRAVQELDYHFAPDGDVDDIDRHPDSTNFENSAVCRRCHHILKETKS